MLTTRLGPTRPSSQSGFGVGHLPQSSAKQKPNKTRVPLPHCPSEGMELSPGCSGDGELTPGSAKGKHSQDLVWKEPSSFPPRPFSCLPAAASRCKWALRPGRSAGELAGCRPQCPSRTARSSVAVLWSCISDKHVSRGEQRLVIFYKHLFYRASAKSLNFNPIPHKISFEYLRAKPVLRSYLVLYPPSFPFTAFR